MDDFRRIFYGVIIGFMLVILGWVSFVTFSGCGPSLSCPNAVPTVARTSIPTLVPGTMPALKLQLGAGGAGGTQAAAAPTAGGSASGAPQPSNPGGPGQAVSLQGDPKSGAQVFAANCQVCHGADAKGGNPNPGSDDGTIPPLNPIDPALKAPDYQTFATNLDLFIEHGSTPAGPAPTFSMPAWGDKQLLNPQQIADVIAYIISLNGGASAQAPAVQPTGTTQAAAPTGTAVAAAPTSAPAAQPTAAGGAAPTEEANGVPRPTNPGGPGPALNLTGDPNAGAQVFAANCQVCHNTEGKGGNPNPGSTDGTIPPLNPIDPLLKDPDPKVFAYNIDLFIEHGSTPDGPSPTFSMPAWGDKQLLAPQQIADVIAYVLSLNK
jgi:mono/diheme cytochrome c family protein